MVVESMSRVRCIVMHGLARLSSMLISANRASGKIIFNAYQRHPRKREKDQLVKKLPWGWVKESAKKLKVFGSFPKDMGTARVMGLVDEHARDAKNALIDRELIEFM